MKGQKVFKYDFNYGGDDSQELLFNQLGQPLIDHAFSGFNNCILAYGQTGSGKSYTMTGNISDEGLIPRIGRSLFERIDQGKNNEQLKFKVEVSYLEIYNEKVRDLLNPRNTNLRVREHPSTGPYVEDLSSLVVSDFSEVKSLISEGNKTRTVAATEMNQTSSRSHAVFTIVLTQIVYDETTNLTSEKRSRINLVDLAGSERSSTANTTGIRLKEGADINKSLATLGRVISALADSCSKTKTAPRVPYRDSVLTWLLKDSLGGNSMTTMVATVAPSSNNYEQSISTLRFANWAKKIENKAVVNEDPNAKLIRELKQELEMLKQKDIIGNDSKELKDQLKISEKLLEDANQTWEQRLQKTQQIQRQREKSLEELGISLDNNMIGVSTPKKIPHLVNLSEDPLLAECLVYNIKPGETVVANADSLLQGIKLQGEYIQTPHCVFKNNGDRVVIEAFGESSVVVNGYRITQPIRLHSGYRIVLGGYQIFRFNHPQEALEHRRRSSIGVNQQSSSPLSKKSTSMSPTKSPTKSRTKSRLSSADMDWEYAIHEVADHLSQNNLNNLADEEFFRLYDEMERQKMARTVRSDSMMSLRCDTPPLLTNSNSPVSNCSPVKKYPQYFNNAGGGPKRLSLSDINTTTIADGEEYMREREALVLKVVKKWRKRGVMRLIDQVLELTDSICKAQAAADYLSSRVKVQLMMLGSDFGHEMECDFGEFEHTNNSNNNNNEDILCCRVVDYTNKTIRIWSIEKLKNRLKRAYDLINLQQKEKVFWHVSVNDPFLDDFINEQCVIGYAKVYSKLIEFAETRVDIISLYTQEVAGAILVSKNDDDDNEYILEIEGLKKEEMYEVVVAFGNDNKHQALGSNDIVKVFSNSLESLFTITIYAKLHRQYLDKLISWDEMQEPGLDKTRLNKSNEQDLFIQLQCLELNELGSYSPTESILQKDNNELLVLHQGLQRRLGFTINSIESLRFKFRPVLKNLRLVDCQGIINESSSTVESVELKIVSDNSEEYSDSMGVNKRYFECQWDSSMHNSLFIDRVTKKGYKILVECELNCELEEEDKSFLISFNFQLTVKPRGSTISRWDIILGSVLIVDWLTFVFTLEQRKTVPQSYDDFAIISPSKNDSFRARGVSILRDYFKSKERFELQMQLQQTKVLLYSENENRNKNNEQEQEPFSYETNSQRRQQPPQLSMKDFETLDETLKLWQQKPFTLDNLLKRWDYRELLVSRLSSSSLEHVKNNALTCTYVHQHYHLFSQSLLLSSSKQRSLFNFGSYNLVSNLTPLIDISITRLNQQPKWNSLSMVINKQDLFIYFYNNSYTIMMVLNMNPGHWRVYSSSTPVNGNAIEIVDEDANVNANGFSIWFATKTGRELFNSIFI